MDVLGRFGVSHLEMHNNISYVLVLDENEDQMV